ncbi:MAG: DUF3800 domain-containing protein [Candidatus Dojkabacteria bacterium]|jgi:hypothetical protein
MYTLFVYIDESGDLIFSNKGSNYYIITSVITHNPLPAIEKLEELRLEILSQNKFPTLSDDYLQKNTANGFHATYDKQVVRNEVFDIIQSLGHTIAVNAVVIEKRKANPSIRDTNKFYSKMSASLLKYIQQKYRYSNLCIMFSGTPTEKKKNLFKSAIKTEIKALSITKSYKIYFPNPKSDRFLNISDYACWAIARKWEKNDIRSYDLIKSQINVPELDIFRRGDGTLYY